LERFCVPLEQPGTEHASLPPCVEQKVEPGRAWGVCVWWGGECCVCVC
jgi:hypothetical protein